VRGAAWAVFASVVLFWAPLALLIFSDAGDAGAWLAGVLTAFAGRAAGEVIRRQRGNTSE
jgi:hypothetical protein